MKQAQVSVTPHVRVCVCECVLVCVLCLCVWPKVNEQLFGQVKKKTEAGTASTSAATSPQAHLAICINNWTFDFKHF